MTPHALVGRKVACYLEELHAEEHRYPGQLEGCPYGEDDGDGVFVENLAELFGEDVACHTFWRLEAFIFQIWGFCQRCFSLGNMDLQARTKRIQASMSSSKESI